MKSMYRTSWALCLALMGFGAGVSSAATTDKPAKVVTTLMKTGAIVEAVNRETRSLKLIDARGQRFSVVVADEVRNFDEIQPRDRIITEYLESVAVVIAPHGTSIGLTDAGLVSVAPLGDKPGVEGVETHLVVATVLGINLSDRLVTLETENGDIRTLKVRRDAPLEDVQVGDQLRLRITRAIAMSVVKPGTP